ncbi:MAG: hypothetical protein Q7S27_00185 [Nanoarchaeota archaeon]|nr:hypothetical protein [Nanoarchaeota archaeon]
MESKDKFEVALYDLFKKFQREIEEIASIEKVGKAYYIFDFPASKTEINERISIVRNHPLLGDKLELTLMEGKNLKYNPNITKPFGFHGFVRTGRNRHNKFLHKN